MGIQKIKWTSAEEEALKLGVAKHGAGKWKNILIDSEFQHILANRSNVDLKDKWRNMGGQSSGAILATARAKPSHILALTPETQNISPILPLKDSIATDASDNSSSILLLKDSINNDKPSQSPEGVRNPRKYNEMILNALSSIRDRNGSEFDSILSFIEKKHEVPHNFRRLLRTRLRKLVIQGRVEKVLELLPRRNSERISRFNDVYGTCNIGQVEKRYKMKCASKGMKTPLSKQKVGRSKKLKQRSRPSTSTEMEDAAKVAAQCTAEAENKSFVAAEAVKESERVSQMADEAHAAVLRVEQLLRQWKDKPYNRNSKSFQSEFINNGNY